MIKFKEIPEFSLAEQQEFWRKAERMPNGCLFLPRKKKGICKNGKGFNVCRVAWEFSHKRKLRQGELVCHRCDNPPCIEPDHLFAGSYKDNAQDAVRKGRWPHGKAHYLADPIKYAARVARLRTPEARAANARGQLGRRHTNKTKSKQSAARKAYWLKPSSIGHRKKMAAMARERNKTLWKKRWPTGGAR